MNKKSTQRADVTFEAAIGAVFEDPKGATAAFDAGTLDFNAIRRIRPVLSLNAHFDLANEGRRFDNPELVTRELAEVALGHSHPRKITNQEIEHSFPPRADTNRKSDYLADPRGVVRPVATKEY